MESQNNQTQNENTDITPAEKQEVKVKMAAINGTILLLIGLLIFITPLTVEIDPKMVAIDYWAGALLALAGAISIIIGLKKKYS